MNGCADTVSVVCRDAGLLERGHQVRRRGANLAIADFFDAGTDCISDHEQEVSQNNKSYMSCTDLYRTQQHDSIFSRYRTRIDR